MSESIVGRIVNAHAEPNKLWVAEGVNHVGAILHHNWVGVVLEFLDEHGI